VKKAKRQGKPITFSELKRLSFCNSRKLGEAAVTEAEMSMTPETRAELARLLAKQERADVDALLAARDDENSARPAHLDQPSGGRVAGS
jgi:hypothetical protein